MSYQDDLYGELRELCRGRGLQEPARTFGPLTRRLTGVTAPAGGEPARQATRAVLAELTAELDDETRRPAELALGFAGRAGDLLGRRTRTYAAEAHCSERTARRRMTEAVRAVARVAAGHRDPGLVTDQGSGWRVRSFTALLRLDTATTELYETRVIMAERALDRLRIELDLPPGPGAGPTAPPLVVEALHGAVLGPVDRSADGRHYGVDVRLGRRLNPGEEQTFCLHYRVPPGMAIRDHYAIVPLDPCDRGLIRVRFDRARLPAEVWRLTAVPPRMLDPATGATGPDLLRPDCAGEITVSFGGLRQGHGYGAAWSFTPARR